jgi:hypothetical protein
MQMCWCFASKVLCVSFVLVLCWQSCDQLRLAHELVTKSEEIVEPRNSQHLACMSAKEVCVTGAGGGIMLLCVCAGDDIQLAHDEFVCA